MKPIWNLKWIIASTLVAVAGIPAATASEIFDNAANNRPTFSVGAAYEYSTPVEQDFHTSGISLGSRSGMSAGIAVGVPLWKNMYLEPGLSIFESQYSVEGRKLYGKPLNFIWIMGAKLNCMLGYHFDFSERWRLNIITGPQLAIGFSSGAHYPGKKSDNTLYDLGASYIRRVDLFWDAGVSVTYRRHYTVGFNFSRGLLNMSTDFENGYDTPFHFKEQIIGVSAAYTF